jgi:hypothetical protein
MDNKFVDILLLIFCVIGFIIGLFLGNFGIFIYNIIFFILTIAIILLIVIKFS